MDKAEKTTRRIGRRLLIFGMLAVCCLVFVWMNREYLEKNPFERRLSLDFPSCSTIDQEGNVYVIDQSKHRVVAFTRDGYYRYQILGGDRGNTCFYSAEEIKAAFDGSIYVSDTVLASDGSAIERERILKFDRNGRYVSTIYEIEYELHDRPMTAGRIHGLTILDDGVEFIYSETGRITLRKVPFAGGAAEDLRQIPCDTRGLLSYAIEQDGNRIYGVTKTAEILETREGGLWKVIYRGRDHDTEEFFSIPWKVAVGGDKTVYFTDIGLRHIGYVKPDGESGVALERNDRKNLGNNRIFYSLDASPDGTFTAVADTDVYVHFPATGDNPAVYGQGDGKISVLYSRERRIFSAVVSGAFLLAFFMVLGGLYQVKRMKPKITFSEMARTNVLIVVVAVIIAAVSVSTVMKGMQRQYRSQVMNNMCSVAELACKSLNGSDVEQINTPQDYGSPAYERIRRSIHQVFDSSNGWNDGLYCVLNRVNENKVIYSCLYLEDTVGSVYPLDYDYEDSEIYRSVSDSGYGSEYKELYETGKQIRFDWIENAEGIWTYVLSPVFNDQGQVVAAMEVGTNLYAFQEENNSMIGSMIFHIISIVAIIILVFTELSFVWFYRDKRRKEIAGCGDPVRKARELAVYVVRPLVFVIFTADCMATAFLPMLAGRLAVSMWGIPQEVMAAVPVSAEVLFTAVFSFAGGFWLEKTGFRKMLLGGGFLFTLGLVCAGISGEMVLFIGAKALIGTGMGFLLVGINTMVASCPEKESAEGFSFYNSGSQAGLTVGTAMGSLLAAAIGYLNVYFVAAIVSGAGLLIIGLALKKDMLYPKPEHEKVQSKEKGFSVFRFLFQKELLLFFVCAMVPYMLYGYFLNYFLPLFAQEQGMAEIVIGQLFLLNGICVIYLGPFLTSYTAEKLSPRAAVFLAAFIYVGTLLLFAAFPGTVMTLLAPLLLGVADSFGFSSLSLCFSGLSQVKSYGTGKAMGVYSTFDNISQTVGPFVFSAVFVMGIRRGVLLLAVVYLVLLGLYMVFGRKGKHE